MSAVVSVQRVWSLEAGLSRLEKKADAHHSELRDELRSQAALMRAELREEMQRGLEALRGELRSALRADQMPGARESAAGAPTSTAARCGDVQGAVPGGRTGAPAEVERADEAAHVGQ